VSQATDWGGRERSTPCTCWPAAVYRGDGDARRHDKRGAEGSDVGGTARRINSVGEDRGLISTVNVPSVTLFALEVQVADA
jgi:hypothetical protein